jgi:hypothetical protein
LKTMDARFRDSAGNVSAVATTTFALDTQPPVGGLYIDQRTAGPNSTSSIIYLGADNQIADQSDNRQRRRRLGGGKLRCRGVCRFIPPCHSS